MTDLLLGLDDCQRFATSMSAALRLALNDDRRGALRVLSVLESAMSAKSRADIGALLQEAEERLISPAAVRQQLVRRAVTTLERVLAADGSTFALLTAHTSATRAEIAELAKRVRAALEGAAVRHDA